MDFDSTSSPIFLQALWRTGSTYLWNKFREHVRLRCYYEPLHESLQCKTRDELQVDYERASRRFTHKCVAHNYYDEFNIAATGGVPGFDRRFILERYALTPNAEDVELETYIQGLIDFACQNNQQAMMQFNRSILRAEWMKEKFGGTHLYLNRNPEDMLNSYTRFGYYLPVYLAIIGQNSSNPVFQEAADFFGLAKTDTDIFRRNFLHYSRIFKQIPEDTHYDIVFFFWALGLVSAFRYADMIIDTDALASPQASALTGQLEGLSGFTFDFSDIKISISERKGRQVSDSMRGIVKNAIDKIGVEQDAFNGFLLGSDTESKLENIL